jgi:hypothetical protein
LKIMGSGELGANLGSLTCIAGSLGIHFNILTARRNSGSRTDRL